MGTVTRSLRNLSFGAIRSHEAAKRARWEDAQDEYDQQFQVPVAATWEYDPDPLTVGGGPMGTGGSRYGDAMYSQISVSFDVWFFTAAAERHNELDRPIFTFGAEKLSGDPAMVTAMVTGWKQSDGRGISGADLLVGVAFPGAKQGMKFNGKVHLNFQGFGLPVHQDLAEAGDQLEG